MANWKYTLNVKDAWQQTKAGEMTIAQFATHAAEKIKALPVEDDPELTSIVIDLAMIAADPDPNVEEFNGVWNELYDWADQVVGTRSGTIWPDKMCWIRTF